MKTLRQVCAVMILSLTLALPVSAGDMHSPGYVPPPPPQPTSTTSITTTLILTILSFIR